MASVTQRIKQVTQPYGGYLKPSQFKKISFLDNEILKEENINSGLVGLAVDYLVRLHLNIPVEKVFAVSLMGARIVGDTKKANKIIKLIRGLDDKSIYNTCKLVSYDVYARTMTTNRYNIDDIKPDNDTINNIRIMVKRTLCFLNYYGQVISCGFSFDGAYTNYISAGEGDYLTKDTILDLKVSKNEISSKQTLQLLIYYIMSKYSYFQEYKSVTKLGIFNPRLNKVYLINTSSIPLSVINEVSEKVIGYSSEKPKIKMDDYLPMIDIMKILSCSRHMVIKYYCEEDLPLVRMKNKYYINKYDLKRWLELRIDEQKKRDKEGGIIWFIMLLLSLLFIIYLISQCFK